MPKEKSQKHCKKRANIPFAKGFHIPTKKDQIKAVGFKTFEETPQEFLDEKSNFFESIPAPQSQDDWLAQYVEEAQTFRDFKEENPWMSLRKPKYFHQKFVPNGTNMLDRFPEGKVYIAKIGDFSRLDITFADLLGYVKAFLCLPVVVLEGIDLQRKGNQLIFIENPDSQVSKRSSSRVKLTTLKSRHNVKTDHIQLCVDGILSKLRFVLPNDALCMIGLTPFDLYEGKTDLFVAGMAAGNQRVAVFSLLRYNPKLIFSSEFWYDITLKKISSDKNSSNLLLGRSAKLLVHELCHLLGFAHCVFYKCCMNGSGHLQEDFEQPMVLCPVCLHKLKILIGFDVVERYKNLLRWYTSHDLTEEAAWMERRINFIEGKE